MKRAVAVMVASAPLLFSAPSSSAPASASASASAAPQPSASAVTSAPVASASAQAPMVDPSGLPMPPGMPQGAMPPGHPDVGGGGDEDMGMPNIPRDTANPDAQLPTGTIVAQLRDENDKPLPKATVKLTINRQSVSEGEKRDVVEAVTDDQGNVRWDGQKIGSNWSYSISAVSTDPADSAAFARYVSEPFQLPLSGGFRVVLHRFPVSSKIDKLLVAVEGVDTVVEVRDDQIEVSQMFELVNAGTTTWSLGPGLNLTLPKGFKAVRAAEAMEDHTAVGTDTGVRWAGSFPPGRSQLTYDYKVTYEGESAVDLEIQLPPRVLAARVRIPARRGMEMTVDGFPPPTIDSMGNGLKLLSTVKQGSPQDELRTLRIHIKGLPVPGNDRWLVTAAALAAAAFGVWLSQREPAAVDRAATTAARKRVRKALLAELVELEKAHKAGDVGPKAYVRERTKLLDAIADTLDPEQPAAPGKPARA